LVEIALFERGWVNLSANFRGEGGSSTNEFWRPKTRVPRLSRGVFLHDPTFSRFDTIPACGKQTHTYRRTHDDGYYPRRASSVRVKMILTVHYSQRHLNRTSSFQSHAQFSEILHNFRVLVYSPIEYSNITKVGM